MRHLGRRVASVPHAPRHTAIVFDVVADASDDPLASVIRTGHEDPLRRFGPELLDAQRDKTELVRSTAPAVVEARTALDALEMRRSRALGVLEWLSTVLDEFAFVESDERPILLSALAAVESAAAQLTEEVGPENKAGSRALTIKQVFDETLRFRAERTHSWGFDAYAVVARDTLVLRDRSLDRLPLDSIERALEAWTTAPEANRSGRPRKGVARSPVRTRDAIVHDLLAAGGLVQATSESLLRAQRKARAKK